ncbi:MULTISPECIES: hypothetical protein [Streptomyces]|nr:MULTISPECIES: hypothetical protein [Streptomyces]MCH0556192.1 hypothetical protein [Streptomyces sp. MUM 16J]
MTHLFRRRPAAHHQVFVVRRELRSERRSVYGDSAVAMAESRRGQHDR